ncbi:uncharacterized protein PHALS_05315 [Plasmopara halstedii]|uniref:RxLR-like protein n=1 Tax=Plasmopara halstedii TaxID=4781 RepID=A0A0P1AA65_PLAHL|nr:uncharacterized protein PHALS_05315 [Plasmopara halstedii]CEG37534.1 hypothetical protein PHALS_05315 [Plasmopara halstedii]|eukprot:XP_024573903.1 hypothetical protein PHALS_05315 [Plasmopara halstedii]
MSEAEDVCGCFVCAVLCSVCCVAAAEEDKRERERAEEEALRLKNPDVVMVNPVAVPTPFSHLQKATQREMAAFPMLETKETTSKRMKKRGRKAEDQTLRNGH